MRKLLHMSEPERTHNYQMQDGFSLVEVIIAVTLLAILTLPILAYFTNASVSTSKGENTQRANLAGETVMEELNAVESFEKLECTPDSSATSGPNWNVSVDDIKRTATVTQDITLDGFQYHVIATVDYNYVTKKDSFNDFNDYEIPELKEVYSPNNVVLEETDQAETALSEYYYEKQSDEKQSDEKQSENKTSILNNMKRVLCVDVEETTDAGRAIYWIRSYYKFFYGGKKKEFTIRESKIEKDKLNNIYIFYKVLNNSIKSEKAQVRYLNFSNSEDIKKLNLYYVLQDTPATSVGSSVKKPTDYVLDINNTKKGSDNPEPVDFSTVGSYNNAHYFSNGIQRASTSTVNNFESSVVARAKGKRIARITVDVYEYRSGSTYPESERLVRLESSKGSNG